MFNAAIAFQTHGLTTERELRHALCGSRTDVTTAERSTIIERLMTFKEPRYLEIGVYFGGNFLKVMQGLRVADKKFHAIGIDLFEDLETSCMSSSQTHELYNKWGILNVAMRDDLVSIFDEMGFVGMYDLVKGDSSNVVSKIGEIVDVAFIDGNHAYAQVAKDFEACLDRCHTGSFIVFHNASDSIEPDPRYVRADGGPWLLCERLRTDDRVKRVELVERCAVFEVS